MTPGGDIAALDGKPRAMCVDGRFVVYMADQDSDQVVELYSVALRDGSIRKLNGPLVADGDVREFQVSPDSTRVVYRADQDLDEQLELYSVPIEGGTAVRLDGPMVAGGDVFFDNDYAIGSDSQRVVYRADELTDEEFALFSVPIAGGTRAELGPSGVDHNGFQVSADASRVVFRTGPTEVWSVPTGGGSPVLLTPASPSEIDNAIVTPDSTRVVYRTRDQQLPSFVPGVLHSVPIDGGTTLDLYDEFLDADAPTLRITPDSSRLVFVSSNFIYTVPPAGGPVVMIANPFWQLWGPPRISPDSQHVVFIDGTNFRDRWVFATRITGGTLKRLTNWDSVEDVKISPDSGYVACNYSDLQWALTGTQITSEFPDQLNWGTWGTLLDFDFAWGSRKVVFIESNTGAVQELFSVSPDGTARQTLNPPLVQGGDVTGFVVGGPLVLYRADQDTDSVFELYAIHMPLVHYRPVGG